MLTSIIINNYNYAEFLEDAILSALKQDSAMPIEVIVVDDGSTDNSRKVIAAYEDRITSVLKQNGGQASAFNAGYEAATGDIICLLDADDYFYSQKITEISKIFQQYPDAGWCFHELEEVDKNGHVHHRERRCLKKFEFVFLRDVLVGGTKFRHHFPATSGLCFRRHVLETIFPMPEAFNIAADSYVRLSAIYLCPGVLSPKRYAVHRQHGSNLYDFREDVHISRSKVNLKSAYYMRQKFPPVRTYTDKRFYQAVSELARTIGLKQTLRSFEVRAYLQQGQSEKLRLQIAVRIAGTYANKRMPWVKPMLSSLLSSHRTLPIARSHKARTVKIHPAPIFILGHAKSGTTAIAMLLSKMSHEALTTDLFYRLDPKKEKQLSKEVFEEKIAFNDFVKDNRTYFSTRLNKSPVFSFLYPQLKQRFPEAKFVFILRDPRDTIRSYLNRREIPGHLQTLSQTQQSHLNRFISIPPTTGSYIERMAYRWTVAVSAYLDHPNEIILVRYEDFIADKLGVIRSLSEQLELPEKADISSDLDTQYQPRGNREISWHEFFGARNLSLIESICAEPMRLLKYPLSTYDQQSQ
ncbi:MAG: glycosyltransferase [Phormidesmis sp.]